MASSFHKETTPVKGDASTYLFNSLDTKSKGSITKKEIISRLQKAGILKEDGRIKETMAALKKYHEKQGISLKEFRKITSHNITIIEKALKGHLIIPDFVNFCKEITKIYNKTKKIREGKVATYIPQLGKVDPNKYGISICTVDGQRFNLGDFDENYCIQSTCKPINYCLALKEKSEKQVHKHIGREPSGHGFNELTLNKDRLPHNPMINAGAIMCCSLIQPKSTIKQRLNYILNMWEALTGGKRPGFNKDIYLSERKTADRNFALGYFMKENGAFPENTNLIETLELYFQCCSIELTTQNHAIAAATLANAGICPINGKKIFDSNTIKHCLSLMYSCGMYDFSGEFAFSIGIPAKSGVSGALFIVIPNVMGITVWAPPLDSIGNSVKGLAFSQKLVECFNFHNYENVVQSSEKIDPRLQKNETKLNGVNSLCSAASQGDLNEIKLLAAKGFNLNSGEYDLRTPIHLAAAEGHANVIQYFIENKVYLNPKDRWGGTPLDDAYRGKHQNVISLLKKHGAKKTGIQGPISIRLLPETIKKINLKDSVRLCWAASQGDIDEIERLVANGVDLDVADYDGRTGLHLAASEGHIAVIQYFIDHGVNLSPKDRFGGTPLIDAHRHKHQNAIGLLEKYGAHQNRKQSAM